MSILSMVDHAIRRDKARREADEGMPERLDKLEAVAVRSITNTYGPLGSLERFWIQKGIEGMRYAVAVEGEED